MLAPFDVFFVGLTCLLDTLVQSEAMRGDRPLGSAANDHALVHDGRAYDLLLETPANVAENAALLLDGWRSGRRVSEFATPPLQRTGALH